MMLDLIRERYRGALIIAAQNPAAAGFPSGQLPANNLSMDGACTNLAEEFFSRMRRAEQGAHRRISNGDQVHMVSGLCSIVWVSHNDAPVRLIGIAPPGGSR